MNNFNLVGMYVTSKTGQSGIVKSVEKKGNKYFLHLIKKHGYAWFEISLLNGAYQYKNINGYDYEELEDLFANCIEGEVSNIAISVLKEHQELKMKLKKYETYLNRFFKINNKSYDGKIVLDLLNKKEIQQKEFIEYLESYIVSKGKIRQLHELGSEIDRKLFSQQCLLEEILKYYKELIEKNK